MVVRLSSPRRLCIVLHRDNSMLPLFHLGEARLMQHKESVLTIVRITQLLGGSDNSKMRYWDPWRRYIHRCYWGASCDPLEDGEGQSQGRMGPKRKCCNTGSLFKTLARYVLRIPGLIISHVFTWTFGRSERESVMEGEKGHTLAEMPNRL
jgi:hypothetical protein